MYLHYILPRSLGYLETDWCIFMRDGDFSTLQAFRLIHEKIKLKIFHLFDSVVWKRNIEMENEGIDEVEITSTSTLINTRYLNENWKCCRCPNENWRGSCSEGMSRESLSKMK